MTYFTGDTHFFHKNVIEYCNCPYKSVEEMNEALIANWNARVGHEDTIYHVGDFIFSSATKAKAIFDRLNGHKHLVVGNHDDFNRMLKLGWESVSYYKEIKVEDQKIVLLHYAMRVWNKSHRGAWQLYGHSHNSLPDDPNARSMDVGVDAHNYAPISFEEIREIVNKKNFVAVDHPDV